MELASLEEKLVSLVEKLELLGEQLAPEATRAVFSAIHLNAVYSLVQVVVGLVIIAIVVPLCVKWIGTLHKNSEPQQALPCVAISALSMIGALFGVVSSLDILFSPYLWIALTDPQAALAMKLLLSN